MKTMKLGNTIKRVKEKEADSLEKLGWAYVPKKEWKINVRDVNREQTENSDKKSKKKNEI